MSCFSCDFCLPQNLLFFQLTSYGRLVCATEEAARQSTLLYSMALSNITTSLSLIFLVFIFFAMIEFIVVESVLINGREYRLFDLRGHRRVNREKTIVGDYWSRIARRRTRSLSHAVIESGISDLLIKPFMIADEQLGTRKRLTKTRLIAHFKNGDSSSLSPYSLL